MSAPSRFLFTVLGEPGHLTPFLGLARELGRAGHTVDFFSNRDIADAVARAGLPGRVFAPPGAADPPPTARGRALAEILARPRSAQLWYAAALHAAATSVDAHARAMREALSVCRPELIVTDPVFYAAVIVAEQERLPWAAIATDLLPVRPVGFRWPFLEQVSALDETRRALFRAHGVEVRVGVEGQVVSPWLNTVFTTEAFAPRGETENQHSIYLGAPALSGPRGDEVPFPWERLREDVPLVYAAFGTQVSPPRELFEALAVALSPDEADLVLVVGRDADPQLSLPPHVVAVPFAPQLALLDRAAVLVTHGGAGSVGEGLARGKPLCVVPLAHEQPLQGELVARSGVGIRLALAEASPARFAAALRPLLVDGPEARRAAAVARSYQAAGGAVRGAELLVELARTGNPIRPDDATAR